MAHALTRKRLLTIRHGNRQILQLAEDVARDSLEFMEAMVEHLNSGYLSEEGVQTRKKEFLQQVAFLRQREVDISMQGPQRDRD